jgi:nitroreductase
MQTWDAIRVRRNVRQYTGQPIARENLERICEAGRRAPSAGNWQPWNFVVVTGRGQADRAGEGLGPRRQAHRRVGGDDRVAAKEPEDERHRDWLMYDFGQATRT